MAEFISTFITGFQSVVQNDLTSRFSKLKILNLLDGLVHYRFDGDSRELEKVIYFNNTYFVLKTMKGKSLSFPSLVGAVCSSKNYFLVNKGSFRVRFQNENQFAKVDKNLTRRAEEYVLSNSKLKLDRLSPTNEVWFSIRREGFAFCGELISKREFTEKNLNKGELRPEFAYLMGSFADLNEDCVVCDPFCGYGSIPVQIASKFRYSELYAGDIDEEKIDMVKSKKMLQKENVHVAVEDAMILSSIKDKSIDVFITDPPWGYYEEIPDIRKFYDDMLDSFRRKMKTGGKIILLTARKQEFESATAEKGFELIKKIDTLVNGKKAAVYLLE